MKNKIGLVLGSDPEIIMLKKKKDGTTVPFSMEGILHGTKAEPQWIDDKQQRGILLDNVLLEFTTAPQSTEDDFVNEHKFMVDYVKTAMAVYKMIPSLNSVEQFSDKHLSTSSAMEFGCSESFNAKNGKVNVMPDAKTSKKRSAGGHIHVSLKDVEMTFDDCKEITRIMDLRLGVPSIFMSNDNQRRKMFYGKAGEFRHQRKRYLEYRSLDNFWIFNESQMKWVWEETYKSVDSWINGLRISDNMYDDIVHVINNYDKIKGKKIIDNFNLKIIK